MQQMYVCMCVYVRMYACMYACRYVCLHPCVSMCCCYVFQTCASIVVPTHMIHAYMNVLVHK